jgi:hypothetical protein
LTFLAADGEVMDSTTAQPKGAKRALLFSDEKAPATRPRMTLAAIANPTPALLQEERRAVPNTAMTTTGAVSPIEEEEGAIVAPVPRRLFDETSGDRGASSSPHPRFKAMRVLFPGVSSPGRWLTWMEKQQVGLFFSFSNLVQPLFSSFSLSQLDPAILHGPPPPSPPLPPPKCSPFPRIGHHHHRGTCARAPHADALSVLAAAAAALPGTSADQK